MEQDGEQFIAFGPEASGFEEALAMLCDTTPAVTLVLRSGTSLGAVLLSVHEGLLVYEHWDEDAAQPSGEPATVAIGEVVSVSVR